MPTANLSISTELSERLNHARIGIHTADLRAAVRHGLHQAAWTSALLAIVLLLSQSWVGIAGGWAWSSVVLLLTGTLAASLRPVWQFVRSGFSLEQTAHWLDAATNPHHTISTALELCRGEDDSPFAIEAIRDGLNQAHSIEFFVLPEPKLSARFVWPWLVILLSFATAFSIPLHAQSRLFASNPLIHPPTVPQASSDPKAFVEHPKDPFALQQRQHQSEAKSDQQEADSASALPQLAMAKLGSGLLDTPDATSQSGLSGTSPQQPLINASPAQSDKTANATQSSQAANSPLQSQTVQSSPQNSNSNTSTDQQSPSQTPNASHQQSGSNPQSGSSGSPPNSPPPTGDAQKPSTSNQPQTQKLTTPDASSAATPTAHQPPGNSDKANHQGQSGGNDAPKKSRGVAPLLLETRMPDLFQGRPLAGPQQRSFSSIKPEPAAPIPAAPITTAQTNTTARDGDEQPVPRYEVPPDLRQQVGDYFRLYEQNAESDRAAESRGNASKE